MVRPIPNATSFALIRDAYFSVKATTTHDAHDSYLKKLFRDAPNGARVDFAVRHTDYGRGVFAAMDIPKGTAVWDANRYGIFRTEAQWEGFLHRLSPDLRYDVTMWAFVMDWDAASDPFVLALDLDEECLFNHGGSQQEDYDETLTGMQPNNLVSVEEDDDDDDDDEATYVAVRDIKAGEEFLVDYSQFHNSLHTLDWFEDRWDDMFLQAN